MKTISDETWMMGGQNWIEQPEGGEPMPKLSTSSVPAKLIRMIRRHRRDRARWEMRSTAPRTVIVISVFLRAWRLLPRNAHHRQMRPRRIGNLLIGDRP